MSLEKIVLGTAQLDMIYGINNKEQNPDKTRAFDILDVAYKNGIKSLDTARAYANSLNIIGECPHSFQVYSKFLGCDQDFFESLKEHQRLLKKQDLISLSFHRFNDFRRFNQWEEVEERGINKKLRIGVSVSSNDEAIQAIQSNKIQLIQIPLNLLDNFSLKKAMFDLAKKHQVAVQVRSIFLQGLFFMDPQQLKGALQGFSEPLRQLKQVAQNHSLTLHELCLRYPLSFADIHSVTFGVDRSEQLIDNLKIAQKARLPMVVIEDIHKIKFSQPDLLNPANWPKE